MPDFDNKKRRAWMQGGLGTSTTFHARHLLGRWGPLAVESAGHAARATCFLAFLRAFVLASKNGARQP